MAPGVVATVVDNASSDQTLINVGQRPGVKIIANADNRGFAGASNQGCRASEADQILLLNPDVRLKTSVVALVEACQEHGLAAGQLTDSDGLPQAGFTIRRLPTPASMIFELLGLNWLWPGNPSTALSIPGSGFGTKGPVEQPAGAFLMIRRDVWENAWAGSTRASIRFGSRMWISAAGRWIGLSDPVRTAGSGRAHGRAFGEETSAGSHARVLV
jgi:GT2 family glycosyltransferase